MDTQTSRGGSAAIAAMSFGSVLPYSDTGDALNILLLVVDSLRWDIAQDPELRFFRRLDSKAILFDRAYATECWTLPAHTSMFTGLLPSQHQAHFQTMGYNGTEPTIAELAAATGFACEVVTRNSIFDGSLPGITRGFHRNIRLLSERRTLDPLSLILAASKPRFRRQIQTSGFFHPRQRQNREFVMQFARATLPADRRTLNYVLTRADELRRQDQPFFLFANLYDVHAPYPPREESILSSFWSGRGLMENCQMPFVMPCLGGHTYLQPGFRLSAGSQRMLRSRYRRAVALMAQKLEAFYNAARDARILDNTLLIITSDHGEAFGEHGLYLHDASVYETHLRVPLWIRHPDHQTQIVNDVVSTRDLFGLMRSTVLGDSCKGTILDPTYRRQHPFALAEHFYYPHCLRMDAKHRQNLHAVITKSTKVIRRREGLHAYNLETDKGENAPVETHPDEVERELRREGLRAAALSVATRHVTESPRVSV